MTSFERVHFRMTPLKLDSCDIWKLFYHQFLYSPDSTLETSDVSLSCHFQK